MSTPVLVLIIVLVGLACFAGGFFAARKYMEDYLKNIERYAYNYSNSYKALSQNIEDFMNNELNELIFKSTYPLGTVLYDFNKLFNESYPKYYL